jgi:hypothetical protein
MQMDVETYTRTMEKAGGRDTWGGFTEASLLWKAWSGRTGSQGHVIILECVDASNGIQSYRVLARVGSDDPETPRICVAWLGAHWVRARLRANAKQMIKEWMQQP